MSDIIKHAAVGVGVADAPEGLSALLRPGCAAAIWRSRPSAGFRPWIDGLDPDVLRRNG